MLVLFPTIWVITFTWHARCKSLPDCTVRTESSVASSPGTTGWRTAGCCVCGCAGEGALIGSRSPRCNACGCPENFGCNFDPCARFVACFREHRQFILPPKSAQNIITVMQPRRGDSEMETSPTSSSKTPPPPPPPPLSSSEPQPTALWL